MRNSPQRGTVGLLSEFLSALSSLEGTSTRPSLVEPTQETTPTAPAETWLKWQLGNQPVHFRVYATTDPPVTRAGVMKLPVQASDCNRIILAPYLAPAIREQLRDAGWSYWDQTGNMLITSSQPFIWISQAGASRDPNPQPGEPRTLQTLKGKAAARLIVELLNTGSADSVRSLAQRSNTSPATASRVTVKLAEERFIDVGVTGLITVLGRLRLARRWAEDYSFAKIYHAKRFYSALGDELTLEQMKNMNQEYRLTGPYAAKEYYNQYDLVTPLPPSEIWIYSPEPAAMIDQLGLLPDRRGNVLLGQAVLPESTDAIASAFPRGGLTLAEPWRVVGDLLSSSGRLASLGSSLGQLLAEEAE